MKNLIQTGACALTTLALLTSTALAGEATHKQPDAHAPIGVMGDHLHQEGEWMLGYRLASTQSSGFKNGNDAVNSSGVLHRYGEGATKMDMNMHMFEIMYGVSEDLTLMVMPQYMEMEMTHQSLHGHGHMHTHEVSGLGDTEVTGLYSLFNNGAQRAHLNFGVSLPTASVDEKFANHHDEIYPMPYNMQFGTGTFDPILGATYVDDRGDWSWGAQTLNYLRFIGENEEGYRQGSKFTATGWVSQNVWDFLSVSGRLEGQAWGNVDGRDDRLPFTTIAGADPDEQAGERVMAFIGANLLQADASSPLAGQRLAAEFGVPLYERYDGPQLGTDYRFTLGWQMAF